MADDATTREPDTVAIFTPVLNGQVIAAVCALNGIPGQVIETSAGAFAVLDDTSVGATAAAGHAVSAFVKVTPILAMERRAGQITVTQWLGGERGETMPPGLALDQAPGVIITLMTGAQTIDELALTHADKVFSARMGRMKAFGVLRRMSKDAKQRARDEGAGE